MVLPTALLIAKNFHKQKKSNDRKTQSARPRRLPYTTVTTVASVKKLFNTCGRMGSCVTYAKKKFELTRT